MWYGISYDCTTYHDLLQYHLLMFVLSNGSPSRRKYVVAAEDNDNTYNSSNSYNDNNKYATNNNDNDNDHDSILSTTIMIY